jgi:multiple sugar transport system permease protein
MMNLKLMDTRVGLILVYVTFNLPFGVLIMRQIFTEIPIELEEAAYIDGAGEYYTFMKIVLPLSINGIIASAVIVFAFAWNEALFALTLTSAESQTLPVFILSSRSTRGVRFGFAAVNTLLAIGPPVLFSLLIQKYLAKGLTFGAVKG